MPLFFYHFFYQNHTFFDFFFLIPISLIIFYNVDICDSPVPSGLSLFFFLPPVFLGGVLLAAFDVDFLLVAFFFSAGFSASGLSSDLPPRTLAILSRYRRTSRNEPPSYAVSSGVARSPMILLIRRIVSIQS